MYQRIRVIMTQEGMGALRRRPNFGYIISKKGDFVYILEDGKKAINRFSKNFWKPYHAEESYDYENV